MARRTRLQLTMTPLGLQVQPRPSGEHTIPQLASQFAAGAACISASLTLVQFLMDSDLPQWIRSLVFVSLVALGVFGAAMLYLVTKEHQTIERDDKAAWQALQNQRLLTPAAAPLAERREPFSVEEEKSRSEGLAFLDVAVAKLGNDAMFMPAAGEIDGWAGRRWTTLMDLFGVYVERKNGRPKKGESSTRCTSLSLGQLRLALEDRKVVLLPYPQTGD